MPATAEIRHDSTAPSDYDSRNRELFDRRASLLADIAGAPDSAAGRVRARRARRELRDVETELVESNMGLVWNYVNRFRSRTSPELTAEYERAGAAGLWKAISTYDPTLGTFSSWAYRPIKREVTRCVRLMEHPNMNYGDFEARPKVLGAVERLGGARAATVEAVSADSGVSSGIVERVMTPVRSCSLSAPIAGSDDATIADTIEDPDSDPAVLAARSASVASLEEWALPALDARELAVVVRHYGLDGSEPETLSSIGKSLGISREAARQIESRAKAKILHPITLAKLQRSL
jgi:RNA polymerase sigma factor (sigma-70 family)